jgi:hypothetical protein
MQVRAHRGRCHLGCVCALARLGTKRNRVRLCAAELRSWSGDLEVRAGGDDRMVGKEDGEEAPRAENGRVDGTEDGE